MIENNNKFCFYKREVMFIWFHSYKASYPCPNLIKFKAYNSSFLSRNKFVCRMLS